MGGDCSGDDIRGALHARALSHSAHLRAGILRFSSLAWVARMQSSRLESLGIWVVPTRSASEALVPVRHLASCLRHRPQVCSL